MKKVGLIFLALIISVAVFVLGFSYESSTQPYTYYQVFQTMNIINYQN